jgi:hypothetical protein
MTEKISTVQINSLSFTYLVNVDNFDILNNLLNCVEGIHLTFLSDKLDESN